MRIRDLLEKKQKEAGTQSGHKIKRDAFLYLAPREPKDEFAQCSTCRMFLPDKERCAILGPSVHVPAEASCGFYIHGEPNDDQDCEVVVKPTEAGLVRREVRCENCASFDDGKCKLYETLNEIKPEIFDLDENVDSGACCNGQTPKDT
jgi:hypothetical protein